METDMSVLAEDEVSDKRMRGLQVMEKLRQLPDNWDSYGAEKMDPLAIEKAEKYFKLLLDRFNVPFPFGGFL